MWELLGTPEARFEKWSVEEIREEASSYNPDEHERIQASYELGYTKSLIKGRWTIIDDLKATIIEHFADLFKKRRVLEIGPGIEDIMFDTLSGSFDGQIPAWYALEIQPEITRALKRKFDRNDKYHPTQGSARKIPFKDSCFDIVGAMNFLDSVIDFDRVASEIHRVLRSDGCLIHIQDLQPSKSNLIYLVSIDPELPQQGTVTFYDLYVGGNGGRTHVQLPGKEPVLSHDYMNKRLEQEFRKRGFKTVEADMKEYSDNMIELFTISNMLLSKQHSSLNRISSPHYAYLIMQK